MPSAIESQIKDRIAAFAHELDLMVRKSTLETLQGILSGGAAAPARRGPGRPPRAAPVGRAPRASGRRPADLGEATTKIVEHVRANDGQGISAIAAATGLDLKVAKKAAIQLLASGALKKSGAKRGTVYHVGSGRPGRSKAKRGARKAKRTAKPGRKAGARRKPASTPSRKNAVVTPAPRRSGAAKAKPRAANQTAVPEALAVAE